MLELMKLPRGQIWPVWEDSSLWGLHFQSFRKLKLSPGNSREVSVKILQSWGLFCGGIQFLFIWGSWWEKLLQNFGWAVYQKAETLILGTPRSWYSLGCHLFFVTFLHKLWENFYGFVLWKLDLCKTTMA
jgi:hypothetical protein